jgi:CTP:molybdopterin cytidylyltransferase MocA
VWQLLDRHAGDVVDVPIAGAVPRDVDTDQDYRAVLSELEEASAWSFRFSG